MRRRLYLLGLLPSVFLLLLSGRLLLVLSSGDSGMTAYAEGSYAAAERHFARNRVLNPVQRWVAPFNQGDALYRSGRYAAAAAAFEAALDHAPLDRGCDVRVNLALSHERLGDAYADRRQDADALEAWTAALAALRSCDRELRRRIEAKAGRVPPQRRPDPPPRDEETERRKRQLERRNEQAQQERLDADQRRRDDRLPPDSFTPLPQW